MIFKTKTTLGVNKAFLGEKNIPYLFSYVFITLSSLLFAVASSQASLKPLSIIDDITYHLPSSAYTLIDISINDDTISIPLVKFESQLPISKGVVLIMADLNAQGSAQSSLYELAKTLPKWGWNTLYIVPQEHFFVKPLILVSDTNTKGLSTTENQDPNTPEDEQIEESEAPAQTISESKPATGIAQQTGLKPFNLQPPALRYKFAEYQAFSANIWQQIIAQTLQKTGYKILLAQGKSAAAALSLLSAQATDNAKDKIPFHALIVSNVYWPHPNTNQDMPSLLSNIQLPVLDLVSQSDNQWALVTAKQRMLQSTVQLKPLYRQRNLKDSPIASAQTQYIAKEVIGWTQYLGW